MKDRDLYAVILGLTPPWRVVNVDVRADKSEIIVSVEHNRAVALQCPTCAKACPGYDHLVRRWRHLDTCQFKTILECSVPRVECSEHGVLVVRVPWSEPGSKFTALMEAFVIDMLREVSLTGIERLTKITWDMVDGIMCRAVERGLARRKSIDAINIGVDEKSRSKRREFVTIVLDRDKSSVIHVGDGRGKDALAAYYKQIGPAACAAIESVTMDMSPAFIATTKEYVQDADRKICFDRFHVAQIIGEAVNQVRRQENKELILEGDDRLKRTRFLFLKNAENHTAENLKRFKRLERSSLVTAKAWRIKEIARHLWDKRPRMSAIIEWTKWHTKAIRTKLAPVIRAADTILRHTWGIANAIERGVSNAKSESFNATVQKIKTRAHGFRNNEHFKNAIYFHLGKLDMYPSGVIRS